MPTSPAIAAALASDVLREALPGRYAHVAAVAHQATEVCRALGLSAYPTVAAAWLHDIGYAPSAVDTGFHPLDGARFLVGRGFDSVITSLVAYHSNATVEALMRGHLDELNAEFPPPGGEGHAILTYCDMTSGSSGERLTIDERLADIFDRYESEDVVHRSMRRAETYLRAIVAGVEGRLRLSPSTA